MDFYSVASSRPFTHGQISWIAQHVQRYDDCMNFENAKKVSRAKNYHERLFLEYIDIPDIYKCLMHSN